MDKHMNFKDYLLSLTEASLNYSSFIDRPERVALFRDKIDKQSEFQLNNGKKVVLVKDFSYNYLDTDIEGFKGAKAKYFFTSTEGNKILLSSFSKTAEFGAIKVHGNKTDLQEVGYLVLLDMLLLGDSNISEYDINKSGKLSVKTDIQDVVNFLESSDSWMKASLTAAKETIKYFGTELNQYTFHHDDELFNKIRTTGAKLSGISKPDKWNPSDVYLIKHYNPNTDNIIQFNDYIFNSKDVIGISLKKSNKEALHGALAINAVNKEFNKKQLKATHKEINTSFIKSLKSDLLKLKMNPLQSKIFVHTSTTNIEEAINNMEIKSSNFFKSLPVSIKFLANAGDDLEDMLKYNILGAMSMSPKSASHYKLAGDDMSIMPFHADLSIEKVRIKLNGDTDVLVDYIINNKQQKLQYRSKGSLPQGIIIKTAETPKDLINIMRLT